MDASPTATPPVDTAAAERALARAAALSRDGVLAPFFDADTDFSAHTYVRSILRQDDMSIMLDESTAESALKLLREKSAALEGTIRDLVRAHTHALLAGAGSTVATRKQLDDAQERVTQLENIVSGLEEDIVSPYEEMQRYAVTLEHAIECTHALMHTQRALAAVRRFHATLSGAYASTPTPRGTAEAGGFFAGRERGDGASVAVMLERLKDPHTLLRAAPVLGELKSALEHPAVRTVTCIQQYAPLCSQAHEAAKTHARALLHSAAGSLNSTDISVACQVLHETRALSEEIRAVLHAATQSAVAAWTDALDVRGVAADAATAIESGAGTMAASSKSARGGAAAPMQPPPGAAAAWRGALWARVETVCETTQRIVLQCWNVLFVLLHARDVSGRAALAAGLRTGDAHMHPCARLLSDWWRSLSEQLQRVLDGVSSSDSHAFVRQTLQDAYPRVHYLLLDILVRVGRSVQLRASSEDATLQHRALYSAANESVSKTLLGGSGLFEQACRADELVAAATQLMRGYLARSFSRLNDAAAAMFPALDAGASAPRASPSAFVAVDASGFTPSSAMERMMEEKYGDPPSLQSTAAFIKTVQSEIAACRPPSTSGGGRSAGGLSAAPTPGSLLASAVQPDAALYSAVCKGVAASVRVLATRADSRAAMGAATVAVARHCTPTPAQTFNLALVARCDDVARALVRAWDELPQSDAVRSFFTSPDAGRVSVSQDHPLAQPRPQTAWQTLRVVQSDGSKGHTTPHERAVLSSAHGQLANALHALESVSEALIMPWLGAVTVPVERSLARMHELTYSTASPADVKPAMAESEYVRHIEEYTSRLSSLQLSLLPSGHVGDTVRAAIASRICSLFVRYACLLRSVDETGRMRLTRDVAHVEAAVTQVCFEPGRLGRTYTEMRALRPFFHLQTPLISSALITDVAIADSENAEAAARRTKIAALLRSFRWHNVVHAIVARMPPSCELPHELLRLKVDVYSDWLDSVAVEAVTADVPPAPASHVRPTPARLFPSERSVKLLDACIAKLAQEALRKHLERGSASQQEEHAEVQLLSSLLLGGLKA